MKMSGGRAVVEALDRWGVEVVFGIPGIHNLALYDALYEHPRMRHVTARHEQGAAFMADGYARASGRPGVVLTTTGPAAVNALTPLGEAYADSSPVLLVCSGPVEPGAEEGTLHEMRDQFATLESVCGRGRRVGRAEEIPGAVAEAFTLMRRGRPRPYVLEVPLDVLAREAGVDAAPAAEGAAVVPDEKSLERAAALIGRAERPLLLAGGGAQGAAAAVAALAERLGAPVGLTANGLGVLPADHALFVGPAEDLGDWVGRADLVLAVGTRLGERTTRWWERGPEQLVHLDVDERVIGRRFGPQAALVGDARAGLEALLELVPPKKARWDGAQIAARRAEKRGGEGVFPPLIEALRQGLEREAIVANDMTLLCYQARRLFPVYAPRSFLAPTYYGTLGFALPAAIGAKLARPGRQVVALCGDGGFLFTGQELATARQQRLCLPIVVCNDHSYSAIRRAQDRECGGRHVGVALENPDFVKLAESFGARGVGVDSCAGLRAALAEALGAEGPTLIEVRLRAFSAL